VLSTLLYFMATDVYLLCCSMYDARGMCGRALHDRHFNISQPQMN